jgi:hypothetical protein
MADTKDVDVKYMLGNIEDDTVQIDNLLATREDEGDMHSMGQKP